MSKNRAFWCSSLFCVLANVGCGAAEEAPVREHAGATRSELVSSAFTDASGTLTTILKTCDFATAAAEQTVSCEVPEGYLLVGGGAEIEGQVEPGALLTASYPDIGSYLSWIATSRSYTGTGTHRLRAYAIGLKIAGFTPEQLKADVVRYVEGGCAEGPVASPSCEQNLADFFGPGHILLGGGGLVLPLEDDLDVFLTESRPGFGGGPSWYVAADSNGSGDTSVMKSVVIGMVACPNYPDGTPVGCFKSTVNGGSNLVYSGTGYRQISLTAYPATGVLTSIGGRARGYGLQRFLTDLIPWSGTTQGVTVWTKDTNGSPGFFQSASTVVLSKL